MFQSFKVLVSGLLSLVFMLLSWPTPVLAKADPFLWRQQVIYLLIPDRFANGDISNDHGNDMGCSYPDWERSFHGGDFSGIKQHIDYLKELGVTAVWSTPIYQQISDAVQVVGCGFHGYWPNYTIPYTGAVEPHLGTDAEFTDLLQTLDANDMHYIMDIVVNHAGYDAEVLAAQPDWFHAGSEPCQPLSLGQISCPLALGELADLWRPCLKGGPERIYCPLFGLPDFMQEKPEVAQYLVDAHLLLLKKFPLIDGIRVDTVRHVELDFFSDVWLPAIREVRPDLFLEGEILYGFPAVPQQVLTPYLRAGFDSVFNFPLRSAIENTFAWEGSINLIADRVQATIQEHGLEQALIMTNLVDNHDIPRLTSGIERIVGPATDPANAEEIRDRYHLALSMLFTLPGIPQLYYGDELGMLGKEEPSNRRDMPEWAWTQEGRQSHPTGSDFLVDVDKSFQYMKRLIKLRQENQALYDGYYIELFRQWDLDQPNVYAFIRGYGDNRILVILNNGIPTGTLEINLKGVSDLRVADPIALGDGSELVELLNEGAPSKLVVQDGKLHFQMPAKSVGVYQVHSSKSVALSDTQ
ncbi:MAG: glycosidase [Cyanothece sp. SIO2G6]|nr:glycosidase [Cyanothece sp. SIO2G6]